MRRHPVPPIDAAGDEGEERPGDREGSVVVPRRVHAAGSSNVAASIHRRTITTPSSDLDLERNVIAISVPREAVGNPADGSTLEGFGASAWAVRTGNTAEPSRVVDSTSLGKCRVGLSCGA